MSSNERPRAKGLSNYTELQRMRIMPKFWMWIGAIGLGTGAFMGGMIASATKCGTDAHMANAAYTIGFPVPRTTPASSNPNAPSSPQCVPAASLSILEIVDETMLAGSAALEVLGMVEFTRRPRAFVQGGAEILSQEYELLTEAARTHGMYGDMGGVFGEPPKERL